jgi:hypothetical protein
MIYIVAEKLLSWHKTTIYHPLAHGKIYWIKPSVHACILYVSLKNSVGVHTRSHITLDLRCDLSLKISLDCKIKYSNIKKCLAESQ